MNMQITLRAARINAGLTQREAGKAIGVTDDVVSRWERGITFPDALQIRTIEKVYGVSYNNLIFLPE